jgi:hypothetical protein
MLNLTVLVAFTLLLMTCKENRDTIQSAVETKKYELPLEVFLDAAAERGPAGQIFITGSTNLPDSLKIGVEIPEVKWKETVKDQQGRQQAITLFAQDFKVAIQSGRFRSVGFMAHKKPYPAGKHKLHFIAHFNGAWQSKEILRIVGDGGKNLRGKIFKKQDPDVIDSDLILDYTITLLFPPLSLESEAIDLVKRAILTVPGRGRSATNVQENIRVNLDLWYIGPPTKGGHRHGHVTVRRSADPPDRGARFDQSHGGRVVAVSPAL